MKGTVMNYVVASSRVWRPSLLENLSDRTGLKFISITRKEDLTPQTLETMSPRYIFFPHWSYIIPSKVFENYECVIFHMTDVPFGRGGSPLQNLISRGIYETRISALRCVKELDAGPVYLKRPLSLYGSAEEIYLRASEIIEEMICQIIKEQPVPVEQTGEITCFSRRKPEQSDIAELSSLNQVFDHIRMLDADGYP
ncbi:MAG TPA: methionyl-tRNA formyltransferase, partial [Desulfobacteraceae bacterium]|nr:methionyl-tRNA formyltransferase [Desulfobacteraceae bacterium]